MPGALNSDSKAKDKSPEAPPEPTPAEIEARKRIEAKQREIEKARKEKLDAKKKREKQQHVLEAARAREQAMAKDVASLERERAHLNTRLIDTAKRIQDSEAALLATEDKLKKLAQDEKDVRRSITDRHDTIAKLLAAMQRISRHPPPPLVTRRDDALKMVRSAMLLATIVPELERQAGRLTRDLEDLVDVQENARIEQIRVKKENKKLAVEKAKIADLFKEKKARLAQRQIQLSRLQDAAKRHANSASRLDDFLERMDKEIESASEAIKQGETAIQSARRKAIEERELAKIRAEEERKLASKPVAVLQPKKRLAMISPGRIKPAVSFRSTRGKLRLPVTGRRVISFDQDDGFGGKAKAIKIETREEAQVTSSSDGWIVYAGDFRSYGQLLIINAGEGYHVLLSGMERIDVSVGQFVLKGEPIAAMGAAVKAEDEDEPKRPVLSIEFRKDGRPIDPDPWWAEGPKKVQG